MTGADGRMLRAGAVPSVPTLPSGNERTDAAGDESAESEPD